MTIKIEILFTEQYIHINCPVVGTLKESLNLDECVEVEATDPRGQLYHQLIDMSTLIEGLHTGLSYDEVVKRIILLNENGGFHHPNNINGYTLSSKMYDLLNLYFCNENIESNKNQFVINATVDTCKVGKDVTTKLKMDAIDSEYFQDTPDQLIYLQIGKFSMMLTVDEIIEMSPADLNRGLIISLLQMMSNFGTVVYTEPYREYKCYTPSERGRVRLLVERGLSQYYADIQAEIQLTDEPFTMFPAPALYSTLELNSDAAKIRKHNGIRGTVIDLSQSNELSIYFTSVEVSDPLKFLEEVEMNQVTNHLYEIFRQLDLGVSIPLGLMTEIQILSQEIDLKSVLGFIVGYELKINQMISTNLVDIFFKVNIMKVSHAASILRGLDDECVVTMFSRLDEEPALTLYAGKIDESASQTINLNSTILSVDPEFTGKLIHYSKFLDIELTPYQIQEAASSASSTDEPLDNYAIMVCISEAIPHLPADNLIVIAKTIINQVTNGAILTDSVRVCKELCDDVLVYDLTEDDFVAICDILARVDSQVNSGKS